MAHTVITGCTTGFTAETAAWKLPVRLEWEEFKTLENVTLYVLALQNLMDENEDAKLSYYQIAGPSMFSMILILGIHGLPLTPWDDTSKPPRGYCMHSSRPLF
jgi:hypothetical protein